MELNVTRNNSEVFIQDVQMASGRRLSVYVKDIINIRIGVGEIAEYYKRTRDAAIAAQEAAEQANASATEARHSAQTAVNSANAAAVSAANAEAQVDRMAEAIVDVEAKTAAAQEAADRANEAAAAAEQAVLDVQAAIESQSLGFPTSMTVDYPARLTYGNIEEVKIKATLYPLATALQNVMFISDNKAVSVYPDGSIHINQVGKSIVHVVPTMKTSLAQTILITVDEAAVRLVDMSHIRLLGNGNFRLC